MGGIVRRSNGPITRSNRPSAQRHGRHMLGYRLSHINGLSWGCPHHVAYRRNHLLGLPLRDRHHRLAANDNLDERQRSRVSSAPSTIACTVPLARAFLGTRWKTT